MSTRSKAPATEKDFERDLALHARLPADTKELLDLKDQAEKATGTEQVVITQQIEKKARKART